MLRIATWNINGLRARLDFVLHWLAERGPDIVGLQELKLEDSQFPHARLEEAGYRAVTQGQKAWNGVAVLSREPVEAVEVGLAGQEAMGARFLTARIGDLRFTTLYCPNGKHVGHEDFGRKLEWLDALVAHLESQGAGESSSVLCGDFNLCPEPIDSWNEAERKGSIFHTDEERERFRRLLAQGFVDLFRRHHPDLQAFSWWDYRGGSFHRNQGLRIDFLLASPETASRVRDVQIDREYRKKKEGLTASDHAPVLADLDV
jgi:exodeoxyribonuclease-3